MEDNSMEQVINKKELKNWKDTSGAEDQEVRSKEEAENLFMVEEIEAV